MEKEKRLDPAFIEICWTRLMSAVDEASISLIRTAFSPVVREFHDFACGLFDKDGNLLAQSSYSTPGLLGSLPPIVKHILKVHPRDSLYPGDVLITNDPWLGSGHLIDIVIATPFFYKERLVGFCLCVVHHLDMGGRMATAESREIFEEGLRIPLCKVHDKGVVNQLVYDFIANNNRVPDRVIGDVRGQIAANYVMRCRVIELLEETGMTDLGDIGKEIIDRTEKNMREEIRKIPNGVYKYEKQVERVREGNVRLAVSLEIKDDEIIVDYAGTSPQVDEAINSPLSMTISYSYYPIKCAINPLVLNNEGCLRPITVKAPEGSVLNAKWPAATWGRTTLIHYLPEVIWMAMVPVLSDRIVAGCGGAPICYGNLHGVSDGESFLVPITNQGGFGASHLKDGHCTLSFPGNVANIPVEISENEAPIMYLKKELMCDSEGPGQFRGGFGQVSVIKPFFQGKNPVDGPMTFGIRGGRYEDPIPGIYGGGNGGVTKVIINTKREKTGRQLIIRPDDTLILEAPGGGGYGDPLDRDTELVLEDVRNGLVSAERAASIYGVVVNNKTEDIGIDAHGTDVLRKQLKSRRKKES